MSYPDVVVVVPGILGTTLVDRQGRDVWGSHPGALARLLADRGQGLLRLRLPDGIGDDHPNDGVGPGEPLRDLQAIPGLLTVNLGYDRLLRHLRTTHQLIPYDPARPERPANLVAFGYDWRLSNRYNGRRLGRVVEPVLRRWREQPDRAGAELVLIGHSMGGLVARWYLEREGGAALTRALITLGTPHRGAAKAAEKLVNGAGVRLGRWALELAGLARSLPSLHQLLPAYAAVAQRATMVSLREAALPDVDSDMVADGLAFHDELATPGPDGYQFHPILGVHQPTVASIRLDAGRAVPLRTIRTDDGTEVDEAGDGTVPRFAARPRGLSGRSPALVHVADTHVALPGNRAVLDQIDAILTGSDVELRGNIEPRGDVEPRGDIKLRGDGEPIGVEVEEVGLAGEPLVVTAETRADHPPVWAELVDAATGRRGDARPLTRRENGHHTGVFADVPPGGYRVRVGPRRPDGHLTGPVTATVILDPAAL